ncbi:hypothetical protein [Cohnella yongneupensis]|uniref:DUF1232 domain-containing protein n=1 Tax=Cohnella yongneupensis TaxID=425006 RepID=A0ABW0QYF5_9BACL
MLRSRMLWLYRLRRLPVRFWRVFRSKQVPARDKLLFIVLVVLYWVLPDLLPFFPIDDLTITALAANWFVGRMEKRHGTLR